MSMYEMSEIIPGVYISSWYLVVSSYPEYIKKFGITHILNLSQKNPVYPHHFQYLSLNVEDDEEEEVMQHFNKTSKWICNALVGGGKVLIHCMCGISRAPTFTIAFLMKKRKMSMKNALNLVKQKRRVTCPNDGFVEQLIKYGILIN